MKCEKGNKVEGLKKMSNISKGLERQTEIQREKDKKIEDYDILIVFKSATPRLNLNR